MAVGWMEISNDQYELPIAVANSAPELARIVVVKAQTIWQHECRAGKGKLKRQRFVRVEVEEEE